MTASDLRPPVSESKEEGREIYTSSFNSACTDAFEKAACLVAHPWLIFKLIINQTVVQDTTGVNFSK
jgi:hypothetical protein